VWKDRKETTIPLDDTRIHSWSLHLDRSLSLVPLPGSVRGPTNMFLLEEGGGISLSIENAGTVNIAAVDKTWSATHVIWHKGKYQDQVWYASALGNLPVRYEHENANGRTLFVLKSIH